MSKKQILSTFLEVLGPYELNEIIGAALRFCFRNPYESIAVVDKNSRVQFMDKPSEQFFELHQGEALGRDIREFLPNSYLPKVLNEGTAMIGRIWEARGVRRIGSIYPLKKNGEIVGAIGKILFHSLEEVVRINSEIEHLKSEVHYLKQKNRAEQSSLYTFNDILGISQQMREAIEGAKKIACLDVDVLIIGESGTGKELFAHSIHSLMNSNKPFVKVNCPAIPFELAESHLFGYERGTFTGAVSGGKAGVFEAADGGTVFLDEIASLPLSIQAKLLRVLQEREVMRLGSTRTRKIKFRSIAATNVNLQKVMEDGAFRHDLYYRIAKTSVTIPPLRERREDIPLYLNTFLKRINRSFNTNINGISDEALEILCKYLWPGNVREMINVLEQIAVNARNDQAIKTRDLPEMMHRTEEAPTEDRTLTRKLLGVRQHIATMERKLIINALEKTGGNRTEAAHLLKMPRSTFYKKLRTYKLIN